MATALTLIFCTSYVLVAFSPCLGWSDWNKISFILRHPFSCFPSSNCILLRSRLIIVFILLIVMSSLSSFYFFIIPPPSTLYFLFQSSLYSSPYTFILLSHREMIHTPLFLWFICYFHFSIFFFTTTRFVRLFSLIFCLHFSFFSFIRWNMLYSLILSLLVSFFSFIRRDLFSYSLSFSVYTFLSSLLQIVTCPSFYFSV